MELGIPNCVAAQGLLRAARQSLVVPWGRNLCQNPSLRRNCSVTSSASMGPPQSQQGLLQRPPALRPDQSGPVAKQTPSPGPSSSVLAQSQIYVQQQQQQQQQQQRPVEQQRQTQTRQQRPTLPRQQEQEPIRRQAKSSPGSELRLPSQAQPQQSLALAVQRPRQHRRRPTMTNVMCNMVLNKQVVAQDDASTVGYVQALMVALNARRVVSLNIKPDAYFSGASCNVPLTAMTQIGDVILIKDSNATSGSSPYDAAADVSGLVGLPVLAANGVELGKVRDFSFNPDNGELVGLKFDKLSFALALPFDLRSRFPVLPEQAVTVWSVHTDGVQQISMSGVQLMPGVLPYQENRGVLDSVTSKFSAFQDAAGKTLGKLPENQAIPVDGMSLVTDPAIERWERECGAASRKYYNLPAEASYEMVMAAVARANGSAQIQPQPLQLPAVTQSAYPTTVRPTGQPQRNPGQPQSASSSGRRDPRSRHLRAASPSEQQSPPGQGQPAAPTQSQRQARSQQPAPPQPFGTPGRSELADMRREIGKMRRGLPRQGGNLQPEQTPQSPRLGGAAPAQYAQDAPGGREFLRFAKPELFAHDGRQP